jgi:ATP-dependent protease ClpP protease subunit
MSVPGNSPEPSSRRRLSAWLQEKLFERRIVLATGRLDADLAAEAAAALMTLDAIGDEPIELHLDSPDGTLESAFVLIGTLDLLRATLHVHCRGQVGGSAIGVAAAADHRSASPHTRFRLFQPATQFSGTPDQIAAHSRQQQDLLCRLYARLAQLTGRPRRSLRTCGAGVTSTPRKPSPTGSLMRSAGPDEPRRRAHPEIFWRPPGLR